MNEVCRARIKCDVDLLSCIRERIDKIRDDEDRRCAAIRCTDSATLPRVIFFRKPIRLC